MAVKVPEKDWNPQIDLRKYSNDHIWSEIIEFNCVLVALRLASFDHGIAFVDDERLSHVLSIDNKN